jgi:hypothetical protein
MLTSRAVRLGSRRIAAGSSRAFTSAAQASAKNDIRQLAPLLAAAGLAVAGTALYREVRGYESYFSFLSAIFLLTIPPFGYCNCRIPHTTF